MRDPRIRPDLKRWVYDESNSDGEFAYLDSLDLGLSVVLESPDYSGEVHVYVYPLWTRDHPLVRLLARPWILPKNISIEEPIFTDGDRRAHFPLVESSDELKKDEVEGLQLLVNAGDEALFFDLYDDDTVYWTAWASYDELRDAADLEEGETT